MRQLSSFSNGVTHGENSEVQIYCCMKHASTYHERCMDVYAERALPWSSFQT